MKKIITILFTGCALGLFGQQKLDSVINPVTFNKRELSGLDIPRRVLNDYPNRDFFQKRLYKGSELSVYILSSETATNELTNFPIEEFIYFMNGKAKIEPKDAEEKTFLQGDYIIMPKGYTGKWTNQGGNKYHLELSVISNKRTDSTLTSKLKTPTILNKELLSGVGIFSQDSTNYYDILYSGIELTIATKSEMPTERKITNLNEDKFIRILNGILTLTPKKGSPKIFYKDDILIIPKNFTGTWKSEAANLFRALVVTQAK